MVSYDLFVAGIKVLFIEFPGFCEHGEYFSLNLHTGGQLDIVVSGK